MPTLDDLLHKIQYYKDLAFCEEAPASAKLLMMFAVFYLFSPIDLIPDFIPIIGFIDDLIIVPLLFSKAFAQIEAVKAERQRQKPEQAALGKTQIEHCESHE